MAAEVSGSYTGQLGVELTHGASGAKWNTTGLVEEDGKTSSFGPTDMIAASLGACVLTLIAIVGEREKLNLEGLGFSAKKQMGSGPRRIERVEMVVDMPANLDAGQRRKLERAARTCPVKNTLESSVEMPLEFRYPD